MRERGWDELDIVLVTGDAYVDHPSFGVPAIGRLLEAKRGYRVGILDVPELEDPDGSGWLRGCRPPSSGWASARAPSTRWSPTTPPRRSAPRQDVYRPGGKPGRPNRATIAYTAARGTTSPACRGDRRARGRAAPARLLRLLGGQAAPLDPGRRQGRPARVGHGRAHGGRDLAPPRAAGESLAGVPSTCELVPRPTTCPRARAWCRRSRN
jgi:hypothetical protein